MLFHNDDLSLFGSPLVSKSLFGEFLATSGKSLDKLRFGDLFMNQKARLSSSAGFSTVAAILLLGMATVAIAFTSMFGLSTFAKQQADTEEFYWRKLMERQLQMRLSDPNTCADAFSGQTVATLDAGVKLQPSAALTGGLDVTSVRTQKSTTPNYFNLVVLFKGAPSENVVSIHRATVGGKVVCSSLGQQSLTLTPGGGGT